MKWYRGNFEIFRFIADEDPPTKIFKLDSFDVDVSAGHLMNKAGNKRKKESLKNCLKAHTPFSARVI